MRQRSHKDRENQKIARAFMTHNSQNKSMLQKQKDFNLGFKVENGTIEDVSDIIRAVSILGELVHTERITKEKSTELKMNLAQKMSGFKIVSRKEKV